MNFVIKEFYPIEIRHSRFLNLEFITDPKALWIFDIYANKIARFRIYFDYVLASYSCVADYSKWLQVRYLER